MKTIILSDIESREESIIPFALNFAKIIDEEAIVLHIIDPRNQHAVSSAYSDSQTFEIGKKLTYDEILEREINQAKTKLDKLLSKEASRLNYPLRTKMIVEKSNLTSQLNDLLGKDTKGFAIISKIPDRIVYKDLDEFFEAHKNFNLNTLVVPPGTTFIPPTNALLISNLDEGYEQIVDIVNVLNPFDMVFNIVDAFQSDNEIAKNNTAEELINSIKNQIHFENDIRITLFENENFPEKIEDHLNRSPYDIVIVKYNSVSNNNKDPFTKKTVRQLIENLDIPVLIC